MLKNGATQRIRLVKTVLLLNCTILAASLCNALPLGHPAGFFQKKGGGEATPATPFPGVSLKVNNETVPPGGLLQFKLFLTEPKPMGRGTTHPNIPTQPTGIALHDPSGHACGVAVLGSNGIQINFISPDLSLGTDIAYPILTIAAPIPSSFTRGTQFPMNIDLNQSFFVDPNGQPYPQELTPGKLTIGGNISITDLNPSSGVIPAGTLIRIFGMGFPADPRVQVEGGTVATTTPISAHEIDITLSNSLQLDGARVRVINKTTNEVASYYPYLRAQAIGRSQRPLLANSYPIFALQTFSSATLPWKRSSTQFTGLALQNPNTSAAQVTLALLSSTNQVLQSFSFSLPVHSKVTRDLQEVFPAGSGGTTVRITSSQPLQMLGLLGDTAAATVAPEVVTAP